MRTKPETSYNAYVNLYVKFIRTCNGLNILRNQNPRILGLLIKFCFGLGNSSRYLGYFRILNTKYLNQTLSVVTLGLYIASMNGVAQQEKKKLV